MGADGVSRIVTYIADAGGYRASISTNEPGTESQSPASVNFDSSQPPAKFLAEQYGPAYVPQQTVQQFVSAAPVLPAAPVKSHFVHHQAPIAQAPFAFSHPVAPLPVAGSWGVRIDHAVAPQVAPVPFHSAPFVPSVPFVHSAAPVRRVVSFATKGGAPAPAKKTIKAPVQAVKNPPPPAKTLAPPPAAVKGGGFRKVVIARPAPVSIPIPALPAVRTPPPAPVQQEQWMEPQQQIREEQVQDEEEQQEQQEPAQQAAEEWSGSS